MLFFLFLLLTFNPASADGLMTTLVPKFEQLQASRCESQLQELAENLNAISLENISVSELRSLGKESLKDLWSLRTTLHDQLPALNKSCTLLVRNIFHQLRDLEDYLTDFIFPVPHLDSDDINFQKEEIPIFNRQAYSPYHVRGTYDSTPFKFQSGDIVLARGVSFFSAIITKLSDNKSHFSHSFIIHVDNTTFKTQTIESYVGKAVDKYDISFALKNENVRLLVLRPRDQELAKRAGEEALKLSDTRALYDYSLNFEDSSELSCVEVLTESFKRASSSSLQIPLYPAQLKNKNLNFISRMNLKGGELITPDDLETDPRFELVLDWKDARLIRNSRYKDAVLAEVIRWSDDLGYNFQSTFKTFLATKVLLPLRRSALGPLLQKIPFLPVIDPHIPEKTLEVMTALDQASQVLLDEIKAADDDYMARNQKPMTNKQLRAWLEQLRLSDANKKLDISLFHEIYRP